MKKVIAVLTTALMTFVMLFDNYSISQFVLADSGLGSIIASGECGANGDNVTWTLDDKGLLIISGKGEMENWKKTGSPLTQDTNAPWHSYNNSIQTIIVDNGVTSVGDWAFAFCFKLKSASIFNDVTRIGEYAFNGCYNLEYVIAGDNITTVDDTVFKEAATYGVECDPFILGVGNSKLSEVYNDIFCPVVHPIDITIVDSGKFGITDNNLTWTLFSDGILEIDGEGEMPLYVEMTNLPPWYEYKEDIKTVIIKDGITNIGAAFYNHTSLKIVSIPESVREIQYAAFSRCSELRHTFEWSENMYDLKLNGVVIPNSVTVLGKSAFYQCENIKSIAIKNPRCEIYDDKSTIANNYSGFNGTIYGYENSTAQTYAENYGRKFVSLGSVPDNIMGDVNKDGIFNVSDIVLLQKWLLAVPDTKLVNWKAGDLCNDNKLNVFDLCLMKRKLLNK